MLTQPLVPRRASLLSAGVRALFLSACLLAGVCSCSRTHTVPPIPTAPKLPAPSLNVPPSSGQGVLEATPVEWSVAPWRPDRPARAWKFVVLHHTATQSGSVESIHRTHLARKDASGNPWRGIGYHFVIGNGAGMEDGAIEPTFRWRDQIEGAHAGVAAYNQSGIGICLVGNFEKQPPTDAQFQSLTRLVRTLIGEYEIAAAGIKRHGELKETACPGRLFPMRELTQALSGLPVSSLPTD